ncbi:MAG: LamG domain-containing protein [Sedimentisphaerales bacterium]|nr:LamG domain-containing protein [Sedimentisphaerales bacterium]
MFKKLILSVSVVLVLDLVLINGAGAVDPDLVGWWKLDEGSGDTAADLSASDNDGAIINAGTGGLGTNGSVWVEDPERGMVISLSGGDDSSGAYVTTDMIIPAMNFENDFTWAFWAKQQGDGTGVNKVIIGNRYAADGSDPLQFIKFTPTKFEFYNDDTAYIDGFTYAVPLPDGVWMHHCVVKDGGTLTYYRDGEEIATVNPTKTIQENPFGMGADHTGAERWSGYLSDVRLYTKALSAAEVIGAMKGIFGPWPYASNPDPKDGSMYPNTWLSMSWRPGAFAVSHDVYMGDNFDDVNDATLDSELFRGNQDLDTTYYFAGFVGAAYPDGLVPGTTYYWRIDEVNEADPNSPWKGDVWSFSVPPKTAYFPNPADGAEFVALNAQLKWTTGFGAKIHYVVFGEDFDEVNTATGKLNGTTTYNPGPLKLAKTYYWRVDESDGLATYKGQVWSFTTEGAVSGPSPADGAVNVKPSVILGWNAGAVAVSHEVYFGTDADAVANATTASPEHKGPKALGEESYDPGKLILNTTYYWRIDEVNEASPDSPWASNVWSFTTGDYFVIDDFEDYDATDNQIWFAWHDGLGAGAPGTPGYLPGNGTGSAVGDETTPSYTEETIVRGGNQSMPFTYDNNKPGYANYSEVEYTLTDQRDWTEQGVTELSLWFRGYSGAVGSFVEGPIGTYTMTGSGADIWNINGVEADEFHFAYKMLTGAGSITARINSVENTNGWAKAGVMIRETLNPDSAHAFACVTPSNGVASQGRPSTGGVSFNYNQTGVAAPYWVKLERSISGLFTVSHSANGSSWQPVTGATAENIAMGSNVYIGLALTSHDAALTCQAVFSNVTTTGNVSGQWASQDIGILSNDAEPLYIAVSNTTGTPAVVVHDNPAAAQINTWTEWIIPLQTFADKGINLTNVDRIAIGLGTQGNMTVSGGSGKMYIEDIRLYQPRTIP